jgi:xanthine dehydrogenase accessory factor
MADWAQAALGLLAREPVALITILATEGSAPRGAGTRMVVTAAGATGTIGGGALEYQATEQARAILACPKGAWRVQDYPLGPLLGQCCGGRVRLLVERLDPRSAWLADADRPLRATLRDGHVERVAADAPMPVSARGDRPDIGASFVEPADTPRLPLLLFGAGHVGQAIARLAGPLPLRLGWFDTRAELADIPGVVLIDDATLPHCAAEAAPDTAILILTHDHGLDYRLAAAALSGPARFVGLIGSRTKRARFLARLAADGFDDAARARLVCPIGLPGVAGKEPEIIAVSAVAQLLSLRTPT